MKYQLIKNINKDSSATLEFYGIDESLEKETSSLHPAIIIVPGGAYKRCSNREGEIVALKFLSLGFNCFVLKYTCNKEYPLPHLDLAFAISYVRNHEEEFHLLPNCVSIMGFSAGGHLCASYSYLYKKLSNKINVNSDILRPFSTILGYPVIMTSGKIEPQSVSIITGNKVELKDKLDVTKHIDKNYPPTFIFATKDDKIVPVENTIALVNELNRNNIKNKCILFPTGWHGASIASYAVNPINEETRKRYQIELKDISIWPQEVMEFIFDLIF